MMEGANKEATQTGGSGENDDAMYLELLSEIFDSVEGGDNKTAEAEAKSSSSNSDDDLLEGALGRRDSISLTLRRMQLKATTHNDVWKY